MTCAASPPPPPTLRGMLHPPSSSQLMSNSQLIKESLENRFRSSGYFVSKSLKKNNANNYDKHLSIHPSEEDEDNERDQKGK